MAALPSDVPEYVNTHGTPEPNSRGEEAMKAVGVATRTSTGFLKSHIRNGLKIQELEQWAADLCSFVARQDKLTPYLGSGGWSPTKKMIEAATALAERPVGRQELKALIHAAPWMALWSRERRVVTSAKVRQASESFLGLMPKSIAVSHQMLDRTAETLARTEEPAKDKAGNVILGAHGQPVMVPVDYMEAVRAAGPFVSRLALAASPANVAASEAEKAAPMVHISLTVQQAKGLDAPQLGVVAEDAEFEVVSEESGAT